MAIQAAHITMNDHLRKVPQESNLMGPLPRNNPRPRTKSNVVGMGSLNLLVPNKRNTKASEIKDTSKNENS